MADQAPVLGKASVGVVAGGEDVVDDHGQDRHLVLCDGGGEGEVDRGVFQRREPPRQHCFGQCTDEVTASGGDGARPLLVGEPAGAVALIEWVQAGVEAVAEHDRLPAHRFGDRGVFALGVAGDVDAAPERQRPRIQRLRQR